MKTHFYVSVYTPGNKKDLLTYCLDADAEDRLNKLVDETDISTSELIAGMWESRKDDKILMRGAAAYVVGTKTFRAAKELFADEKGFPFIVCMKLTKGEGQGHVQMCGASKIKEDTMDYVVKVSKELFRTYGQAELSTI